ncbi:MAG: hypothetical protein ACOZFS_07830 [Thermodesulfobacteriota bacterium]
MNTNRRWQLFDYLDSRGKNVMQEWAKGLGEELRARLDLKIDVLERAEEELPPKLLTPTSGKPKQKHIKEIPIKGEVALRPMLCRGPFNRNEFTFLYGAVERDNKYVPRDAPVRAEANRVDLLTRGEKGREQHKRFN